jgi:hypothetical protein
MAPLMTAPSRCWGWGVLFWATTMTDPSIAANASGGLAVLGNDDNDNGHLPRRGGVGSVLGNDDDNGPPPLLQTRAGGSVLGNDDDDPSLAPNASGGFYILVIYIIIYIYNKSIENRVRTGQTHGKPAQTRGNTAPVTVWVRCSRVRVRVEQNIPGGNPCHALGKLL